MKGVIFYFVIVPGILMIITKSPSFLFWIYFQPLTCMTYFLALVNVGFHGFIEYSSNDKPIPCVNSSCIIGGDDDYFGEDNHMAHHYSTSTYYKQLDAWVMAQLEDWEIYLPSTFYGFSIVELSILILMGQWKILASRMVIVTSKEWKDYLETNSATMNGFLELAKQKSQSMSEEELEKLANLLRVRAERIECTYEEYQEWVKNPVISSRK